MTRVFAIDPGAITGWAWFVGGELYACGKAKRYEVFLKIPDVGDSVGGVGVVERPIIYTGGRAEKPDADILTLGLFAGECAGTLKAQSWTTEYVTPREWKGTIGKPAKGEQYVIERRVLAVLSSKERQLINSTMSARSKTLDHNMIDAVGIGLWKLGRRYRGDTQ